MFKYFCVLIILHFRHSQNFFAVQGPGSATLFLALLRYMHVYDNENTLGLKGPQIWLQRDDFTLTSDLAMGYGGIWGTGYR